MILVSTRKCGLVWCLSSAFIIVNAHTSQWGTPSHYLSLYFVYHMARSPFVTTDHHYFHSKVASFRRDHFIKISLFLSEFPAKC